MSKLKYAQFNSKLARSVLGMVYREGRYYRVPFGPLRGHRLYYDASVNFHAILGLWELENVAVLGKALKAAGMLEQKTLIADVGANIGLVSLWFEKLFGDNATIHAFEPAPEAKQLLQKNLFANQAKRIEMIPMAMGDKVGKLDFFIAAHHHCSSLVESWASSDAPATKVTVDCTTLDEYYKPTKGKAPHLIKMDIEGSGQYALKGCDGCIEATRPLLWIESHIPEEDRAISDLAVKHKYAVYRAQTRKWIKKPGAIHPDPEGVWGTVLLCPEEKRSLIQTELP
jgi:FkbM family methyltransferase